MIESVGVARGLDGNVGSPKCWVSGLSTNVDSDTIWVHAEERGRMEFDGKRSRALRPSENFCLA